MSVDVYNLVLLAQKPPFFTPLLLCFISYALVYNVHSIVLQSEHKLCKFGLLVFGTDGKTLEGNNGGFSGRIEKSELLDTTVNGEGEGAGMGRRGQSFSSVVGLCIVAMMYLACLIL